MAIKTSAVTWEGDLPSGKGTITKTSSGVISQVGVSWASRTGEPNGLTSPEELLAAAHASCFAMALSAGLGRASTPPQKLEVSAAVEFDRVGDGFKVKSSALEVTGWVAGIDQAKFAEAAEAAKEGCPISGALKGNVDLSVKATLAS